MKKLFIFLFLIIGLIGALIVALPFILPMDMVHEKVIAMVNEKTGGQLQINGKTSFSIIPSPSITLKDIRFKTAPDLPTTTEVQARSVTVKVKLMPLLSKNIEVNEFVIFQPFINITKHKAGSIHRTSKQNTPSPASATGQGNTQSDESNTDIQQTSNAALPLNDISLENVRIVEGRFHYKDQTTGKSEQAEKINATLQLRDLDHPLNISSDLVWHKKKISLTAMIDQTRELLENRNSEVNLDLKAPDVSLLFTGNIDRSEALAATGNLKMHSNSVRQLLKWTGQEAPLPGGLQNLNIHSDIQYSEKFIKLTKTKLDLDKSKMTGHITVYTAEKKPRITGQLALNYLNLNTYLTKSKVYGWSSVNGEYRVARNGAAAKSTDTPLDFRGLQAINADLGLSLGGMRYQNIKLGKTNLHILIKDAVLKANLKDFNLYQGRGIGQLTLNGKKARTALKSTFNLSNISVLPLLKDAADFAWLSGSGNVKLDITGIGSTVGGLKKTLNGTTDIKFTDGAIEGINIAQMLRSVTTGALLGLSKNTAQKTDFSALTARLNIKNGVVHNNDLKLSSPLLRITGKGKANLVTERLDYRVEPKIVASLEGQNGSKASGLNIPLNIKGTFSSPKVQPDLKAMLANPKDLVKSVKGLGKSLKNLDALKNLGKNKQVKDLLKGLF